MTTVLTRAGALTAAAVLCTSIGTAAGNADAAASAQHFKNCTALNKVYKHGVGKVGAHDHVSGSGKAVTTFKRSNALYAANKASDRDKDMIACEKH